MPLERDCKTVLCLTPTLPGVGVFKKDNFQYWFFLQNTNKLNIKQTNVISSKLLISSCYHDIYYDIYEGSFGSCYNFWHIC